MSNKPDDWHKPRSHGQRLTEAEIETLRKSFRTGTPAPDAARALQCSTRIARKYYSIFRGNPQQPAMRAKPRIVKPSRKPVVSGRHYVSSFEPS